MLTLAEILRTKDDYSELVVSEWNGSVEIRPLTSGEGATIEKMQTKGMKTTVSVGSKVTLKEIPIDFSQYQDNYYESCVKAIEVAMRVKDGDGNYTHLKADQVRSLKPASVVPFIANAIFKLSGVGEEVEKDLRTFRQD